jgi:uncharacterized glyoxalase superfamily protein PhnB
MPSPTVSLSLYKVRAESGTGAAAAERFFAALGDGGQVRMPLGKTFFSPKFGMIADRFGVLWIICVMP